MNNEQNETLDVYVEIDTLLDTISSTLHMMSPAVLNHVLITGKYRTRLTNNFKTIGEEYFNRVYSKRTKRVLVDALPTNVFNILLDYYADATVTDKLHGGDKAIKFYINTFPYLLTNNDREWLLKGLKTKLNGCEVELINYSPKELKPKWFQNNIALAIMLDAVKWAEYHTITKDLVATPLVDVSFITPALGNRNIHKVLKEKNKRIDHLFEEMSKSLGPLINLTFLPIGNFVVLASSDVT